ncbi:MAG TPA: serine hydrolase [Streptomyces sp.]|jgi:hypothetical protein|nr:serine hydrolase [Streptomyces sp.]
MDKYGTWDGTSGVGDLKTLQSRGAQDRYRVASTTKTFVSTVLLQLEAEIGLEDTVQQRLPGVVHGHGHDGSKITVGKLLNQQLDEMTTTVPTDEGHPDVRYGLGLRRSKVGCGKEVWAQVTSSTFAIAVTTRDGSHALAFNFNGDRAGDIDAVVDAEFCGK